MRAYMRTNCRIYLDARGDAAGAEREGGERDAGDAKRRVLAPLDRHGAPAS